MTFGPFHEVAGTGPEQENMSVLDVLNGRAVYTVDHPALTEATADFPAFHRAWAFWKPGSEGASG